MWCHEKKEEAEKISINKMLERTFGAKSVHVFTKIWNKLESQLSHFYEGI